MSGKVIIANTTGLCFGVERALEIVLNLAKQGKKVATLGPLAHNSFINSELSQKNVKIISCVSELKKNTVLVVRAHGISKNIMEEIKNLGIEYEDATCPFVAKIHRVVSSVPKGCVILIAGNKFHPEVVGILGHCKNEGIVFKNYEELKKLTAKMDTNLEAMAVAQTTFCLNEWLRCTDLLKEKFKRIKFVNTVCAETQKRQSETEQISKISDVMLVIGDPGSSNTLKLKNIGSKYCKTYLVESARQIRSGQITRKKIGLTTGTSTPDNIIEEVLRRMSEILNNESEDEEIASSQNGEDEQSFSEMLEESLKELNTSKHVRATVEKITPNEVYVNIGRKQTGFIPISELSSDPSVKPEDVVRVGDELDLLVLKVNDQEGMVMLSKRRMEQSKGFKEMAKAFENKTPLKGIVTEIVKGGLIVPLEGVRVFVPNSQATTSKDDVLEDLLQKEITFRIIEVDRAKNKVVGSVKSILNDERKKLQEKFWETAEIGKKYKGTVKTLKEYGAFVDVGGIDGMLHISEISWTRISHPSDVFKVGDEIEVYIKNLNPETKKISLGYKKDEDNPWEKIRNNYEVGDVIDVKIVGFTDFGAFARVKEGVDGLIHISQIADYRVEIPQDVLEIGQVVKVAIREIDFENKRLSLSIKEVKDEDKLSG
ncbi:MAG: bifunctional 4-hydroxy-3-methylbut-2-enyl diphosphate reductase/30S ribosomal protein S1 [Oscillospiraceae bacterium]|nr:bifunctional 4-hydroxy-3-methylbut-2-enyl diphosphate reductase/30S ribosomal protein S1 [Oscillospiraceae bacterium]